jgi:hypothetical protein
LQREAALVDVPPPPAPPTRAAPHEDPAFQQVKGRITGHAQKLKKHPPASAEVKKAQAAAVPPANDKEAKAKTHQAEKMSAAKPGEFNRDAFIAAVKKAIDAASPKTLDDADKLASSGKAGEVKERVMGEVTAGKTAAAGDIKQTTAQPPDPSREAEKPVTPLAPAPAPPAAADPGGAQAMPAPAPAEQTNLGQGPAEVSNSMASADVTEQQLKESNEPQFQAAVEAKKAGEEHSAKAPAQVRAEEKGVLQGARGSAAGSAKASVAAMVHAKAGGQTKAEADKAAAKAQEETARKAVATKIDGIYDATKKETEEILKGLDEKVSKEFTTGEAAARAAFEASHKADMEAYKDKRYSGWIGAARWLKDKIFSLPPEVNAFYEKAKKIYLDKMDVVIGKVADLVGAELTKARERIARGRKEIDAVVAEQPASLRKFALEKQQSIGEKFDALEADVDAKQESVVEDLAAKYVEARNAVDERIKSLQEENKGLWDKAKDMVGEVIATIKKLKDMLLNVLAKAAGVIGKIIKKPIEFLGNLVNAVKTGLSNFVANIAEHLKGALQSWLFGALADAGIELPKSFDLKGILHLIFQLLGLTWQNIRGRIVKGLGKAGEAIMTKIEQGVEVIKIIVTEGLPGLWKLIVEKISDLKEQVIGKIKDFVITKIVIAGVTWLISLLNPASAFVKACKMIYDIVMFFVEKGEAIMEFVNTVLDSMGAIASGAIGGAAAAIEGALKRILPILLGFLASLLGLGGISDKIKSILEAVQKPVAKVLDAIIGTAVKYGKKLFGRGIAWAKGKIKKAKEWGKKQLTKLKNKALGIKDTPADRERRARAGADAGKSAIERLGKRSIARVALSPVLGVIKVRYGLKSIEPYESGKNWAVRVQTQRDDNGHVASRSTPIVQRETATAVTTIEASQEEYEKALENVFPAEAFDPIFAIINKAGAAAGSVVAGDPTFQQYLSKKKTWVRAGTMFHNEASNQGKALAGSAPAGWTVKFEHTVASGLGGSRLDVHAIGPNGEHIEVDWKTSGISALGSIKQMEKHKKHAEQKAQQPLTRQQSKSWLDFVRPHLPSGFQLP